jgi:uncharacterized phage infection (PIP) family protein YhgE
MATPTTTPGQTRDENKPSTTGPVAEWKNKAQEMERSAAEKAREMAGVVTDKTKETVSSVTEKAKEAAAAVAHSVGDLASSVGKKADEATSTVGSGMQSLATNLRSASTTVADKLESGGHFLQEEGLKGITEDLTNLVRRNPIPALFCGIGLGFLIARCMRR